MFSLPPRQSDAAAAWPSAIPLPRPPHRGIPSHVKPLGADVHGASRRVNGVFASVKNKRPVPWANRDQRDLMGLLELDPAIISYEEVPETVALVLDGQSRNHVPAFRVRTHRGAAILDAFRTEDTKSPDYARIVGALTEIYADRGIPYRAMSGRDIRVEPRFQNCRWALARRAYRPSQADVWRVTGALSVAPTRTIAELEAELTGVANVDAVVCAMAANRIVALGLSAALPKQIPVSLNEGAAR